MNRPYYETFQELNSLGIQVAYSTAPGGYHPLHWHEEIELLYQLNGESTIQIDEKKYRIANKHLTVIDSFQVHSTQTYSDTFMYICIHISRRYMERYLPDIDLYHIHCIPDDIPDALFPEYLFICQRMEDLTRLYIEDASAGRLETEGVIMMILAHLFRWFSTKNNVQINPKDKLTLNRIREVITYVGEHFREPVSLQEIADQLGLGREYFCRFFKKNMGMSFLRYLNEVRVSHIYQDLVETDLPVSEIANENGFSNQKLFNRTFKEIYGCTPSQVRKGENIVKNN